EAETGDEAEAAAVAKAGEESAGGDEAAGRSAKRRKDDLEARSVMLASERLGAVAQGGGVEATMSLDRTSVTAVQRVEYKVGAPREGADGGMEIWDADRMQLGLQCLILRDNGYVCGSGVIYYRQTKQRVLMELTPELEAWVIGKIEEARRCAE